MTKEYAVIPGSGWVALPLTIVVFFAEVFVFILAAMYGMWQMFLLFGLTFLGFLFLTLGFFILDPNQAAALVLFGTYKGTVRENGFWWRNPFILVHKVSLRARNLNGEKLKVNDKSGNPIEIAAVVVWRVEDTAQALFDVDQYQDYVKVQSEAALRHLAGRYPYDEEDAVGVSLRGRMDEVIEELKKELQERLSYAGVHVLEARISHLAYAPEIAGAMLRRQQAQAIIAARTRIVEGAVGMVEMALTELSSKKIIDLDDERKAAMVSNLLVVLCSEESAHPVVNAGTLYS